VVDASWFSEAGVFLEMEGWWIAGEAWPLHISIHRKGNWTEGEV